MRKVYDYKDIRRLDESTISEQLKQGTIITATADLAAEMTKYYDSYQVLDIHTLLTVLTKEWEENVKDVKNYVKLRQVIADYIDTHNLKDSKEATYLQRNAFDIWNAIRILVEADVYPSDIPDTDSKPVHRFKEVWEEFEKETESIMLFRTTFAYELSVAEKVEEQLSACTCSGDGKITKDIYMLGFYFITPIQERVIDMLENAGYHIAFLNCYDSKYPFAMQVWEHTFQEQYKSGDAIEDIQPGMELTNPFGEAIHGNKLDIPIRVTKHYSEFEFAEMVKGALDKGEQVYSPNAKVAEDTMIEFYPERYDKKHLLSYPVGQYIYYLHMMWDSFSHGLDIRYEYVKKCFASGWLIHDGKNGKQYQYEMKVLEQAFSKCTTEHDWKEMLQKLIKAKKTISVFDNNRAEKGKERWHQLLGNPFYNLAIYNIDLDKLEAIQLLIEKMIVDIQELFPNGNKTDLYDHFQRVTRLIKEHIHKDELLGDEKKIAKDLINQLSDETTKGIACPMDGIRDAIIMLVGNHFDEYESQEEETSDKQRMVKPLSMVEAGMMSKQGETLHLVLADEFNMPGAPKQLPWPLSNELLDDLQIDGRSKTRRYVKAMRSVIENRPLVSRYMFFSLMGILNVTNPPNISVEWICEKGNKEIAFSPYIGILGESEEVEGIEEIDQSIFGEIAKNEEIYELESITPPEGDIPEVVKMDYLICKEKYLYSYIWNRLPSFSSDFHYSFVMSKMISVLALAGGYTFEDVAESVYELFPFFRTIEKRQSLDFAPRRGSKPEPFVFDEVQYPGNLLIPHYLNSEVIDEARTRYNTRFVEHKEVEDKVIPAACTYCQFSGICIEKHKEQIETYES